MNIYTGNQNDLSIDQFIVTDRDIYRKISNRESYDLYMLTQINDKFVWDRIYDSIDLKGAEIINMDRFSYTLENTIPKDSDKFNFLTIYKVDENNTLTHTTIFNGSYDLPFYWNELSSPVNIRLINKYTISKSLMDLPTHIDLTQECPSPLAQANLDEEWSQNQTQPLDGWHDMINNDGWLSWTGEPEPAAPDQVPDPIAPAKTVSFTPPDQAPDPVAPDQEDQVPDKTVSFTPPDPTTDHPVSPATDHPVAPATDEEDEDMIYLEDVFEEERIDPYTGGWYTESEFIHYYRGDTEWIHQEPNKVLLREEYLKFTNTFSYLGAKKFIFLFNQYERTFR